MDGITVDLDRLHDSWRAVRANTNAGFRDGLHDTDPLVYQGVRFGAQPIRRSAPAREALKDALHRHIENATNHLRRADQIAAFLEHMLTEYSAVDARRSEEWQSIMDEIKARPSRPSPPAATASQQ